MNPSAPLPLAGCAALVDGLLAGCDPTVVAAITSAGALRRYTAGATIFAEGAPLTDVYCHCSGDISIRIGRGAARHEVDRSRRGMLLGFREPERFGRYIVSAVAITDAELYAIPIDLFLARLHSDIGLLLNVMRLLSERIDALEERLLV